LPKTIGIRDVFGTPYACYTSYKKTVEEDSTSSFTSEAMLHGSNNEAKAFDMICNFMRVPADKRLRDWPLIWRDDVKPSLPGGGVMKYPWLTASLDGVIEHPEHPGVSCLLEIKCPFSASSIDNFMSKLEEIPTSYLLQVYTQMLVTKIHFCLFAVLITKERMIACYPDEPYKHRTYIVYSYISYPKSFKRDAVPIAKRFFFDYILGDKEPPKGVKRKYNLINIIKDFKHIPKTIIEFNDGNIDNDPLDVKDNPSDDSRRGT
jgi:hypothetical protein